MLTQHDCRGLSSPSPRRRPRRLANRRRPLRPNRPQISPSPGLGPWPAPPPPVDLVSDAGSRSASRHRACPACAPPCRRRPIARCSAPCLPAPLALRPWPHRPLGLSRARRSTGSPVRHLRRRRPPGRWSAAASAPVLAVLAGLTTRAARVPLSLPPRRSARAASARSTRASSAAALSGALAAGSTDTSAGTAPTPLPPLPAGEACAQASPTPTLPPSPVRTLGPAWRDPSGPRPLGRAVSPPRLSPPCLVLLLRRGPAPLPPPRCGPRPPPRWPRDRPRRCLATPLAAL